ncbi:MAG: addiction module protein [Burkholderiales bacterium]
MSTLTFRELEQQARTLPADERKARLVEVLLDSLRETEIAEIEAEWEREVAGTTRRIRTRRGADILG